jgi:hypothetical protein
MPAPNSACSKHARLRVGAIQERDLVERTPSSAMAAHDVDHERGLVAVAGAANARTGSPLPSLVHRFLPRRIWLCG